MTTIKKTIKVSTALLLCLFIYNSSSFATSIFINEIHYDNIGGDKFEAIEIAGPANIDLSSWSLVLYNGNGGGTYNNISLSGLIPNLQNGFGTICFNISGIQNGAPDGIALINNSIVEQFLSYEGILTATNGLANGMTSLDIGVSESNSSTLEGYSLQLSGTGSIYEDFSWDSPAAKTYNNINIAQTFSSGSQPVPEPTPIIFLGTGLLCLAFYNRKFRK